MAPFDLMPIIPVDAAPLPRSPSVEMAGASKLLPRDRDNRTIYAGEPPRDRTIFTVLSLFCIIVLSLLLGSRFSRLRRNAVMKRNLTSMLVLAMYISDLSFIICSAVMLAGQGLYNYGLCFSATWICLILYTLSKFIIYVFLVERIHIVRAPFVRRSHDWLYLSCLVLMSVSFLSVAINAYLSPIITMGQDDGRCHMGIPGKASIPFMSVDIVVDVALTIVFVYLLRPMIEMHGLNKVSNVVAVTRPQRLKTEKERHDTAVQKNISTLLWKSLIGSLLIMIPTVANMIQFYLMGGRELALICLTLCTIDVSWDAVVIHWLTFGSAEQEKKLSRATQPLDLPLKNNPEQLCPSCKVNKVTPSTVDISTVATPLEEPPYARLTPSTSHTLSVDFQRRTASSDSMLPMRNG